MKLLFLLIVFKTFILVSYSQENILNLNTANLKLEGFDVSASYDQSFTSMILSNEENHIAIIFYPRKLFPKSEYITIGFSTKEYSGMIERNSLLENAVLDILNSIYENESSAKEKELITKAIKVIEGRLYEDFESEFWLRGRKPINKELNIPSDMRL